MFEFFKDPFGTKRIADLRTQIADLQTQIARTPVAMGAYHILARNLDKLHGVDLAQAKGLFAAERPYRKPAPVIPSRHSHQKLGEDQYL